VKIIRAAAIQLVPDLTSGANTVSLMCDAISDAAKDSVQLAVFPETFVPYYPYFSFVAPPVKAGKAHLELYKESVVIPGPLLDPLLAAASEHSMVLCVGINERDGDSLFNSQLIIDSDGSIRLKRRKITPTYHERMIWGRGDGSGLKVVDTAVGRIGALTCWEHYNPLARYTLMADHEEIHCAQFPGSMVGQIFSDQIEATIRHHALEAGCFVVNSTGWLTDVQREQICPDEKMRKALTGGCYIAIISPEGNHLCDPITEGEGMATADLDFSLITKRKRMLDSVGHYSRPDLFSLTVDKRPQPAIHKIEQEPELLSSHGNDLI